MEKIVFNAKEVMPWITRLAGLVDGKSPLPILNDVLFTTKDGKVTAMTSDGGSWLSVVIPCLEVEGDLHYCLNVQDLVKTIRNLGGKDVSCSFDRTKNEAVLSYANGNGNIVLPLGDDTQYPSRKEEESKFQTDIDAIDLYTPISKVSFASSTDELHIALTGVYLCFNGKEFTAVSTDGRQLACAMDYAETPYCEEEVSVVLPKKPCGLALSLLETNISKSVRVSISDSNLVISCEQYALVSRLIDSKYPNYKAVIPQQATTFARMNKNELLDAIKRVSPLGDAASNLVKMHFTAMGVDVMTENVDYHKSAHEFLMCQYNGEEMNVGVRGASLTECVRMIFEDEIVLEVTAPNRPIVAYGCGTEEGRENLRYIAIVMPMILS